MTTPFRPRYGGGRTALGSPARGYPGEVLETNYWSGDDYAVEFLDYRFSFSRCDFEERVVAAAVKLGLLEHNELDDDETADLVELAADGQLSAPPRSRSATTSFATGTRSPSSATSRSSTGCASSCSAARGSTIASRRACSRSVGTTTRRTSATATPNGDRALLEIAPVPSWRDVRYRR